MLDNKLFKYILSDMSDIDFVIKKFNVDIDGILHIGAHECQELETYKQYVNTEDILWIEAYPPTFEKSVGNPDINIINELVSDEDNIEKRFNIYNNTKLNSLCELVDVNEIKKGFKKVSTHNMKTKTLKTIYSDYNIKPTKYNFLSIDTQGTELSVLTGMGNVIDNFNFIFIEVFELEIYSNNDLFTDIDNYLYSFGFKKMYLRLINGFGNAFYIK
jgi:FkbM family methyltransferase